MRNKYLLICFIMVASLCNSCVKEFEGIKVEKVIVLRSKTYSNIYLNDNLSNRTIKPDLSVIISDAPEDYNYNAYTYGENSSNEQLGEEISWAGTITTDNDTTNQVFGTTSEYFFLFVRNLTSTTYGPIYVNYGNSDQITEYVMIPANNGIIYQIAYYKVHSDTKIRFQDLNNSSNYVTLTAGTDFNFPNTENQNVTVTITNKESYVTCNDETSEIALKVNKLNH